jgi:hypothetical protein
MTQCPTEDVLLDYTGGRLDPVKTALFEQHADQCARCASLKTAQAAVWMRMDEWKPAPVSEGFNRELWRRIDAEEHGLAGFMRFSFWKHVAPLAVAVALVVTAYVMDHSAVRPGIMPVTSTTTPVVVSVSDADQLERALDDVRLLHEADAASATAKPSSVM